jgi:phage-related protein
MLVGEMLVRLGVKNDLKKGLTDAERDVNQFGGRTQSVFGKLASAPMGLVGGLGKLAFGLGAVGAAGGVALAGVSALTMGLIGSNMEFETYEARFTTMLGSAEKAKIRMQELADFGAKTPFELPGVVQAEVLMQQFGLTSEETLASLGMDLDELRTTVGDVAAGVSAPMNEIAMWIGRFASGNTGEAIMRLTELGVVSRKELADTGLEFSKSGQLMTDTAEAIPVFMELMNKKFGGQMEVMSNTAAGRLSNIQDRFGELKRAFAANIFEVVSANLQNLLILMENPALGRFIEMVGAGIGTALGLAIDSIVTFVQALRGDWSDDSGIHPLHRAVGNFGLLISQVIIPGIMVLVGIFTGTVFPVFSTIVGVITGVIGVFSELFSLFRSGLEPPDWSKPMTTFSNLPEPLQKVGEMIFRLGVFTRTTLIPAFNAVVGVITGTVIPIFETLIDTASSVLSGIWGAIKKNLGPIMGFLAGFSSVFIALAGFFALLGAKAVILSVVMAALGPVIAIVAGILGALLSPIGLIAIAVGLMAAAYKENWFGIRDITNEVAGVVYSWIIDTLIPAFTDFWATVEPILTSFGEWILNTAIPALTDFGGTVVTFITDTALPAITGFWETVSGIFTEFAGWLTDTGIPAVADFGGEVVSWFSDNILPTLTDFGTEVGETFGVLWDLFKPSEAVGTFMAVWDTIKTNVTPIMVEVKETAIVLKDALTEIGSAFGEAFGGVAAEVIPTLQSLWNIFSKVGIIVLYVVGAIGLIIFKLAEFIVQTQAFKTIVGAVWKYVESTIINAITIISNVLQLFMNLIQGDWGEAWENVKTILSSFWDWAKSLFELNLTVITAIMSGIAGAIGDLVSAGVSAALGFLDTLVTEGPGKVSSFVGTAIGHLAGWVTDAAAKALGWYTAMMTEIGKAVISVPGKVGELVTAVGFKMLNFASDAGKKALAWVTNMITEFGIGLVSIPGKVWEIVTGIHGKLDELVNSAFQYGVDFVQGLIDGIGSMGQALWDWVKEQVVDKAKNAVTSGFGLFSPSKWMIEQAKNLIDGLVVGFDKYSGDALESAEKLVGSLQNILGGMTSIFSFSAAFDQFSESNLNIPDAADLAPLIEFMEQAMGVFAPLVEKFKTEFLDAASKFSDTATKGLDLIIKAATALATLSNVPYSLETALSAVTDIKRLIEHAVLSLGDSAMAMGTPGTDISRGDTFLANASIFSEAATVVVELLSKGADALLKLMELPKKLGSVNEAVTAVKWMVQHLVLSIGDTAQWMASQRENGFVGAAGMFSEAASKAMDLLDKGFGFLKTFTEFEGKYNLDSILQAVTDIKWIIQHTVESIGDTAVWLEDKRASGFFSAAVQFSETAISALSVLGTAFSVFKEMADSDIAVPGVEAINKILDTIILMVRNLELGIAGIWSEEVPPLIAQFAETAVNVVGTLFGSMQMLNEMAETEFVVPSITMMNSILDTIILVVRNLELGIAGIWAEEMPAIVQEFADTAGKVLDIMGDGAKDLMAIADFVPPSKRSVSKFIKSVVDLVKYLDKEIEGKFKTEALTAANNFTDTAGRVLGIISQGVDAIMKIGEPKTLTIAYSRIDDFLDFVAWSIEKIHEAARDYETDGLTLASQFASAGSAILDLIGKATNFDALKNFGGLAVDAFKDFLKDIKTVVQLLIELGKELDEGLEEAAEVARKIAEILNILPGGSSGGGGGLGGGGGGSGGGNQPVGGGGGGGAFGLLVGDPKTGSALMKSVTGMLRLGKDDPHRWKSGFSGHMETLKGLGLATHGLKDKNIRGILKGMIMLPGRIKEFITEASYVGDINGIFYTWAQANLAKPKTFAEMGKYLGLGGSAPQDVARAIYGQLMSPVGKPDDWTPPHPLVASQKALSRVWPNFYKWLVSWRPMDLAQAIGATSEKNAYKFRGGKLLDSIWDLYGTGAKALFKGLGPGVGFPSLDIGGVMKRDYPIYAHRGEIVASPEQIGEALNKGRGQWHGEPVTIQVMLNSEVLTEAVLDDLSKDLVINVDSIR